MKIQLRKRAALIATSAIAAGLVFGGVATAAWLANGSGTGSTKALTAVALTTSDASSSASAQLYPGATNVGSLSIKINNTNPYPVKVTDIVQAGTVTAAGGIGTCTTTGVSLTSISGVSDVIAANSTASFTHSNVVSMANTSETGCQGATFTIPVTVTGASGS